jgi:uncharacterized delta-60 repeat protein
MNAHETTRRGKPWLATAITISTLPLVTLGQSPIADSFDPGIQFNSVYSIIPQPDEKVVLGGAFNGSSTHVNGRIARVNADGTVDPSLNPGANGFVYCTAMQADGKIVVGGDFNVLGRNYRAQIGRFNPDGSLDPTFTPLAGGKVTCLAIQPDGRTLVGGSFYQFNVLYCGSIARINTDGTLDPGFTTKVSFKPVACLAIQPDGKILVGGGFDYLGDLRQFAIGRLHADGTPDPSFTPEVNGEVNCVAVQPDGRILVAGQFSMLGGVPHDNFGRLNADGTMDVAFDPAPNDSVNAIALQADGRILLGGRFTTLDGKSHRYLSRLQPDGQVDPTFAPEPDAVVHSLAIQDDGRILVGGLFYTLGGGSHRSVGRLNNTEPATQSLALDGSTLTWLRGGTSPEVWRTTFDYSPDGGTSWTNLGNGVRIPGGWQLAGLTVGSNTTFRARGYVVGGLNGGSTWFVEAFLGPPTTNAAHLSVTAIAGMASLRVAGDTGRPYILDYSSTLALSSSWQPLTAFLLTNNPQTFIDNPAASTNQRFYRARLAQ